MTCDVLYRNKKCIEKKEIRICCKNILTLNINKLLSQIFFRSLKSLKLDIIF